MIYSSNYVVDHITTCVTFLDWRVTPDILPYSLSFQDPKNNLKITTPYGFFFFFLSRKERHTATAEINWSGWSRVNQKTPKSKSAMNERLLEDSCQCPQSSWAERLLCKKEALDPDGAPYSSTEVCCYVLASLVCCTFPPEIYLH